MESLLIQFYAAAELCSLVFGRLSWAYHLEAEAKRKKKKSPFFLLCFLALLEYSYFYI